MNSKCIPVKALLFGGMIFLLGCSNGGKSVDIAPFSDGMYLKYKIVNRHGSIETYNFEMQFEQIDNNTFDVKILFSEIGGIPQSYEVKLDKSAITDEDFNYFFDGRFWIPVNRTKKGKKFREKISDRIVEYWIVEEETQWKGWDVWVLIKDAGASKYYRYFEKNTGFKVGEENSLGLKNTDLIETNVDGLLYGIDQS